MAWTLRRFAGRRLVVTTSFGMEGCALIDMVARHGVPIPVVYLDTMFLFPETYALRDRMAGALSAPPVREPRHHAHGRGAGGAVRARALAPRSGPLLRPPQGRADAAGAGGVDVWMTGLMRSQGGERADDPRAPVGRTRTSWCKVNPLAGWDRRRVWDYVRAHDVPYNELHERGYPTLGCTHCTVAGGRRRTPRLHAAAGRWAGTDKTECGLHYGAHRTPRTKGVSHAMTGQTGIQGRSRQAPGATPARHHRRDAGLRRGRTSATTTSRCSSSTAPISRTTATRDARSRRRASRRRTRFMVRVAIPAGRDHRRAVPRARATSPTSTATARSASRPARASSSTACSRATSSRPSPASTRRCSPPSPPAATSSATSWAAPRRSATPTTPRCGSVAEALARELRPGTRAYHEIWLDGEKQVLDRAGGAVLRRPVPAAEVQDRGRPLHRQLRGHLGPGRRACSAIVRDGRITGFNLLVGGGLGMTHNKGDTTARLAQPLGFVPTEHGVEAVRIVAAIFRDHGNRSDRRHARLKYLLAEWGIAALPRGVPAARVVHARRRRWRCPRCPSTTTSAATASATAAGSTACSSRAGGSWTPRATRLKTALHEIVTRLRPGIRLTGAAEPAAHRSRRRRHRDGRADPPGARRHAADPALGRAALLDGLPRAPDLRPRGGGVGARHPGHPRPVRGRARRASASGTRRSRSG